MFNATDGIFMAFICASCLVLAFIFGGINERAEIAESCEKLMAVVINDNAYTCFKEMPDVE